LIFFIYAASTNATEFTHEESSTFPNAIWNVTNTFSAAFEPHQFVVVTQWRNHTVVGDVSTCLEESEYDHAVS
jgi:hypothetical protein